MKLLGTKAKPWLMNTNREAAAYWVTDFMDNDLLHQ